MDGYRHNSAEALRAQPIAPNGVASGRIGTDPEPAPYLPEHLARSIRDRRPFNGSVRDTKGLIGYITAGGTYIVATHPALADGRRCDDLVAISPTTGVYALRITVNPDLVEAIREAVTL